MAAPFGGWDPRPRPPSRPQPRATPSRRICACMTRGRLRWTGFGGGGRLATRSCFVTLRLLNKPLLPRPATVSAALSLATLSLSWSRSLLPWKASRKPLTDRTRAASVLALWTPSSVKRGPADSVDSPSRSLSSTLAARRRGIILRLARDCEVSGRDARDAPTRAESPTLGANITGTALRGPRAGALGIELSLFVVHTRTSRWTDRSERPIYLLAEGSLKRRSLPSDDDDAGSASSPPRPPASPLDAQKDFVRDYFVTLTYY